MAKIALWKLISPSASSKLSLHPSIQNLPQKEHTKTPQFWKVP
ncbi:MULTISPECIES: hypothetical protein [Lactococcus]|nr:MULTISPECIES: hypothetical protein [Lactococcus]